VTAGGAVVVEAAVVVRFFAFVVFLFAFAALAVELAVLLSNENARTPESESFMYRRFEFFTSPVSLRNDKNAREACKYAFYHLYVN
jgi:hypothetical protein